MTCTYPRVYLCMQGRVGMIMNNSMSKSKTINQTNPNRTHQALPLNGEVTCRPESLVTVAGYYNRSLTTDEWYVSSMPSLCVRGVFVPPPCGMLLRMTHTK